MLSVTKYVGLTVAIVLGLGLGQAYSPTNSLPSIVRVDENFLAVMRNHALFLGFGASLAACMANLLLRIPHSRVLLTVPVAAALWFTWFEAAEPDFLTYLAGALAEFLALFLLTAAPVVAVFWLVERKFRRSADAGGP